MKKNSNWINKFETFLLSATVILSGLISLLDFIGVLDSIPWLAARIPILILLFVGLVAGYLILERRIQLEKIQKNQNTRFDELEHIINNSTYTTIASMEGVEMTPYESGTDLLSYAIQRMQEAQCQIDDLSWSPVISLGRELNFIQEAFEEYEKSIANISENIAYREVYIFNRPDRKEKLKRRIAENSPGYSCAYYEELNVPLIQFMIIDRNEVIVLSEQFQTKFSLRHPYIVKLFEEYYEKIWRNAIPIKIGKDIKTDVVNKILS